MTRRAPLFRAIAAVGGLLAAGLMAAQPTAAEGTAPPWAPGGVDQDSNAIGGLTFYDAAGNILTSGSTSSAPFAAYVEGRKTTRTVSWTDTKAVLYAFVPQEGQAPDIWTTSTQLGLASDFPNATAPGALATDTLPVYSGHNDDTTLDTVGTDFPNTSTTPGYANVYEIRLYTNAPRHTLSAQYDYADISINTTAHTWSLVYSPSAAVAPDAPTGVQAVAHNASATVSWTAPASDGGAAISGYSIEYSSDNGTTWSAPVSAGTSTSKSVTGLTNGTAYVFRVAATNSTGTGAYSTASAPVTPVADASAFTIAAPRSARYGTTFTVSGKLSDSATHGALGGQSVKLYRRAASNKPWAVVKTVTTSSSGAASVAIKASANAQFQWRYAGSPTHNAANSPVASTTVSQVVAARANHTSIKHGTYVLVYGTVSPAGAGQKVYLQQLARTWKTVGSAAIKKQKLPNGKTAVGFVLKIKLTAKGTARLRVYKPATATLVAGYSGTVSVKVT